MDEDVDHVNQLQPDQKTVKPMQLSCLWSGHHIMAYINILHVVMLHGESLLNLFGLTSAIFLSMTYANY